MRQIRWLGLAILIFLPNLLYAGQIYGFITSSGRVHARAEIQVYCPGDQAGRPSVRGMTADDGSYRVNVPRTGQCTLRLPSVPGGPSAAIVSYPNPVRYNFQLVGPPYVLQKR
jgi:hypothetical protein